MSNLPTTSWQEHLSKLVTSLRESGALTDPRWIEAFYAVPRHVFIPATTYRTAQERDAWLRGIYRDDTVVTATTHHPTLGIEIPTSSSTRPSLMARMLELLDVHDGMRVLEIGTGTGYNAGLLTHRLGGSNVTSIDVDPAFIAHARHALHTLNLSPHLIVGDGTHGAAERAPFDRIIATCAVAAIPPPWITQLAPAGKMLVNLRGEIAGGELCLLTKDRTGDEEVIGPFLTIAGHFMWARHRPTQTLPYEIRPTSERDQNRIITYPTTVTEICRNIDNPDFRFLAQLHIPGIRVLSTAREREEVTLRAETTDGSWVRADSDGRVSQGGIRRLWDSLHTTHTMWRDLNHPCPVRFGVVANLSTQFVYLDHDTSWTRWPLPLL